MKRPGGRSARVRDAVRQATLAELALHGFQGLTVENVAQRSGVHKTTVYRRWGSAEGLVADALDLAGEEPWPVPDTGTLAGDLRELADMVRTGVQDDSLVHSFVAAAFQNGAAAEALHRFYQARHEQSAEVVRRAVDRGELGAEVDAEELVRLAIGPLFYRIFISREPITEREAERVADAALAAARAGILDRAPAEVRTEPAGPGSEAGPASASGAR
ncbi:TetR/AcrR family transcriptional regulator [Nonomuraea sp. NPDC050328]|uniref:TetR/AcrR family transcriptional regulator n=1 Tax=Nonomuraea sp. NPDC050328 TaxID=3364361 RepID=UPI00378811FA